MNPKNINNEISHKIKDDMENRNGDIEKKAEHSGFVENKQSWWHVLGTLCSCGLTVTALKPQNLEALRFMARFWYSITFEPAL